MGTIYCIENIVNKKKYVGSNIDNIDLRWKNHKNELKDNRHGNPHLQNAYNKYGKENFKYWIIEDNISNEILLDREVYWTKFYNTLNKEYGYNIVEELGGGRRKLSDESRQKMRDNHPDTSGDKHPMFGKNHTEEAKKRISNATSGENNPMYGKQHTEDTKQKMSENHSDINGNKNSFFGKRHTEESKQLIKDNKPDSSGDKNPFYGKRHTEDVVKNLKIINSEYRYIITDFNGNTYFVVSLREFCRVYNLNRTTMRNLIKDKTKLYKNYNIRYATEKETEKYSVSIGDSLYIKIYST